MDIQENSHWYTNIDSKHCVVSDITENTVVVYFPSSGLSHTYGKNEFLNNFHQHKIEAMR